MGFDLSGKQGSFSANTFGWCHLLTTAEEHGWEPFGTAPRPGCRDSEWGGGYSTNDGQMVHTSDARALADAIERAIVADGGATIKGEKETWMRQFIDFARGGWFLIY